MKVPVYPATLHPGVLGFITVFLFSCCVVPGDNSKSAGTNPSESEWGAVSDGLQSKIRTDTSQFAAADPIPCHYIIRNASDQTQKVWHNGFWPTNRIEVTDPAGKPASLTVAGQSERDAFGGPVEKNYPVSLEPGKSDDDFPVLDLRRYFIMTEPGTYTVQYTYQSRRGSGPLRSNTLQIVVSEK